MQGAESSDARLEFLASFWGAAFPIPTPQYCMQGAVGSDARPSGQLLGSGLFLAKPPSIACRGLRAGWSSGFWEAAFFEFRSYSIACKELRTVTPGLLVGFWEAAFFYLNP